MNYSNLITTLSNGKSFPCEQTVSILEAAKTAGLVLEHSCRNGRCGVCKAKVLKGNSLQLKMEYSLTEEEIAQDYILTCCRAGTSDLELDIEDLGDLAKFKTKTLPARIDSISFVSHDVVEVVLRTPPASKLAYLAGQYVDVIGPHGVRRSYSLANAPRNDGKLKLYIRKVEGGQLSRYWFEEANVNDLLRIEGPLGTFCLRPKPAENLILLATGTGIAPIKAILEELSSSPAEILTRYETIHLYWGGRLDEDLFWEPDFPSLPLRFTPVLSRGENRTVRSGYVQSAVKCDQIDLGKSVVYACGSETMINSARETLVEVGLDSKHFYSDAFVCSSNQ